MCMCPALRTRFESVQEAVKVPPPAEDTEKPGADNGTDAADSPVKVEAAERDEQMAAVDAEPS